jgi:ribosomal protein L21
MYAIVQDRGHQYRVETGTRFTVDRSPAAVGETVELPVLFLKEGEDTQVGTPFTGKTATCKVIAHPRGKKGVAGFFRRRKDSRRRVGFRADQTVLELVSIA